MKQIPTNTLASQPKQMKFDELVYLNKPSIQIHQFVLFQWKILFLLYYVLLSYIDIHNIIKWITLASTKNGEMKRRTNERTK